MLETVGLGSILYTPFHLILIITLCGKVLSPLFHRLGSNKPSDCPSWSRIGVQLLADWPRGASATKLLFSYETTLELVTLKKGRQHHIPGNCAQGSHEHCCKEAWGKELCVNICFCLNVFLPVFLHQLGESLEECCLSFWREDPRTHINERRGSHSWQNNKDLQGALDAQWGLELFMEQQESPTWWAPPDPAFTASPLHVGRASLPTGLTLYGTINEPCWAGDTSLHCWELGLVTRLPSYLPWLSSPVQREGPFQQFAELGCKSKGHIVKCVTSFTPSVTFSGIDWEGSIVLFWDVSPPLALLRCLLKLLWTGMTRFCYSLKMKIPQMK